MELKLGAGMPLGQMAKAVERLKRLAQQSGWDWRTIKVAPQFVACVDKTYGAASRRYHNSQMFAEGVIQHF